MRQDAACTEASAGLTEQLVVSGVLLVVCGEIAFALALSGSRWSAQTW